MSDASFSDQAGTSGADPSAGKRVRRRDSLFLSARLSVNGGASVEVRVRNLSEGGLMAEGAPPAPIGAPVLVEIRNLGAVPGKVAWYTEKRAGIAFDVPVDPQRARKPVGVRTGTKPAHRAFTR